jgi:hypothetical protein
MYLSATFPGLLDKQTPQELDPQEGTKSIRSGGEHLVDVDRLFVETDPNRLSGTFLISK